MTYNMLKILLLLVTICAISGCSSNDFTKNSQTGTDSANLPDSEVEGAKIYLYDRGSVTTEIVAERIIKFEAIDSTIGYSLDIVFFDSLGHVSSTVVGDSGLIREAQGMLHIYGNVIVDTEDSAQLETDYLYWDKETQKIRTDAFVRITDKDDNVITGWGMIADRNLVPFKILRQVSGTIQETGEHLEP